MLFDEAIYEKQDENKFINAVGAKTIGLQWGNDKLQISKEFVLFTTLLAGIFVESIRLKEYNFV